MLKHRSFNRPSLRLAGHNYAGSTYCVTFCTAYRDPILGQVMQQRMRLSPLGRLVARIGFTVMRATPNAVLLSAIIMPDHVHALVRMGPGVNPKAHGPRQIHVRSLPDLLNVIKSLSTKAINRRRGTPGALVWQRSFHDHIIRDAKDLAVHYRYIVNNPARWDTLRQ